MKPSLAAEPLSRSKARTCFVINQLATPGLGSLIARRFVSGTFQLLIAVAGCVLILVWMYHYFHGRILAALDEPAPSANSGWLGLWGLALFGAAWLWSLFTSISILRHVEPEPEPPPIISEPPQQSPEPPSR